MARQGRVRPPGAQAQGHVRREHRPDRTGRVGGGLSELEIRRATGADAPARRDLLTETWLSAYAHIYTVDEMEAVFARRVRFELSWSERRGEAIGGLVAWFGETPAGLLGMVALCDGAAEVAQLYVRPAYQGRGVGSALWDEALRDLGERGVRRLHVWTLERAPAVPFYLARGCADVGRATASVGTHVESVVELARDVP